MKFNAVIKQPDESNRIRAAALLVLHVSKELNFGKGMKQSCRKLLINYLAALDGLMRPDEQITQLMKDQLFIAQECAALF